MARWNHYREIGTRLFSFTRTVLARFIADRCLPGAGALSYATIVSLVPLVAIALGIFSAFPIFAGLRSRLLGLVLENFAPEVGAESAAIITGLADHAAATTAVGVIGLVVSAIVLLATVEEHLGHIFGATTQRLWGQRILAYWTVLTLGPLLLGAGLTVTGDVDALVRRLSAVEATVDTAARVWLDWMHWLLPFASAAAAFALLYRAIPNRTVAWRACAIGAGVAAALLELLKFGFGLYISNVAGYSAIYGALAGIPILLLWMYIFWGVVLLGAEIASSLDHLATPPPEAPRTDAPAPDAPDGDHTP